MSATVLVTDHAWPSLDTERTILASVGAEVVAARTGEEAELIRLAAEADAIITNWRPVTDAVLRAAPRCQVVSRYGVGVDNIAVDTATELGIVVANAPGFCTDEVADHTLALLLSHARHIARYAAQTAGGGWDLNAFGPMHRLRGRTLGLVGYGDIARAVAVRAAAFGMRVLAFSPSHVGAPSDGVAVFTDSLAALLPEADVLSLHLPATANTTGLIGAAALARMKPDALLINTSRGALVDQEALRQALADGRIGGAALDVFTPEPPPADHPLRAFPTVTLTPHAAFLSTESLAVVRDTAAHNAAAVLAGQAPTHMVNPEVLASAALRTPLEIRRW